MELFVVVLRSIARNNNNNKIEKKKKDRHTDEWTKNDASKRERKIYQKDILNL